MKAAIVREVGKVGIEDIPLPTPNEYQAVAEVLCWATCNSTDYRVVNGTMSWLPERPLILGHETVGRIVEVGKKVRNYKVGDVRLRITAVYPGEQMGEFRSGLGGFTAIGLATDTEAMKADGLDVSKMVITHFLHQAVPAEMNPADAAMIINLREALSWVKALNTTGKKVLILGDGPVGMGFVQSAVVCQAKSVILVGRHDERLALAQAIGAHHTINSRNEDYKLAVKELSHGQNADILVDCIGDQKLLAEAISLVEPDGKIAAYGSPKYPPTGPAVHDARIANISTDEAGSHTDVLNLIDKGLIAPRNFYSESLRFDQIAEAITKITNKQILAKVVLFP